jgi:hypothetical protein
MAGQTLLAQDQVRSFYGFLSLFIELPFFSILSHWLTLLDSSLGASGGCDLAEYKRRKSLSGSRAYDKNYFDVKAELEMERKREQEERDRERERVKEEREREKERERLEKEKLDNLVLADDDDANYSFSYSSDEEIVRFFLFGFSLFVCFWFGFSDLLGV